MHLLYEGILMRVQIRSPRFFTPFSLNSFLQFVGVEGLITGIMDMLPPKSALGSLRREVVAAICCVICFLIDMSMVTEVE